jgi:hypothetical protein
MFRFHLNAPKSAFATERPGCFLTIGAGPNAAARCAGGSQSGGFAAKAIAAMAAFSDTGLRNSICKGEEEFSLRRLMNRPELDRHDRVPRVLVRAI